MLRSHGWVRDLPQERQQEIIARNKVDEFNSLYFFVHPGFNIRPTEINAFLGLKQLEKLDGIIEARNSIWHEYHKELSNVVRTQSPYQNTFISPLAFGLISKKRGAIVKILKDNLVECRPLICGSIHRHPFWNKNENYKNANILHEFGMYVPAHQGMTLDDVQQISRLIKAVV
jgi:CDP-6-deoxy-D-xylo-4-hexulose-3-dehydrase